MTRLLRTTAIAMALVVLFGCGSSGDDETATTDTTSPAADGEFSAQLNDICDTGNAAIAAASQDFSDALHDLSAASNRDEYAAALADVEAAADDAFTAVQEFKASVADLEAPDDVATALADYVDALAAQQAVARELRDAAAPDGAGADSAAALDAAIADVQDADTAARQARSDAAEVLGADNCVSEAAGGSSNTTTTGSPSTTEG